MNLSQQDKVDQMMMARCIALSRKSGNAGEYPFAAVVCRNGAVVAESTNRVTQDGDVTRHAEVVAISKAQGVLRCISLDDCEIYTNTEPCASCCYAIRESRIRRVVYGLTSPLMGGASKWNILGDSDICSAIPEVFAPPPEIISGFMAREAEEALIEWNPLIAEFIKQRGLFVSMPRATAFRRSPVLWFSLRNLALRFLRRNIIDYLGRR